MTEIVLGIGSSHSPLLNSPAEEYALHAEIDAAGRRRLRDSQGRQVTYDELLARADPSIARQITPAVQAERAEACVNAIARLGREIEAARLDALIVIGDDQHELYGEDNLPALLVYWGETIRNMPLDLPADAPAFWRRARTQYHAEIPRDYPVDHRLARHVIEALMDDGFDVAQARTLADGHGEGHAFGFVHRRLMPRAVVPIVPVALNTYFPPNQPRPARCYALGQALARAVHGFAGAERVGVLASGGLSHFVVDEALDRRVLEACRAKDGAALAAIDPARLDSGTSEIRNWIATAGAVEHLDVSWQDYVPCYRSPAGTGCGMGFAVWR